MWGGWKALWEVPTPHDNLQGSVFGVYKLFRGFRVLGVRPRGFSTKCAAAKLAWGPSPVGVGEDVSLGGAGPFVLQGRRAEAVASLR